MMKNKKMIIGGAIGAAILILIVIVVIHFKKEKYTESQQKQITQRLETIGCKFGKQLSQVLINNQENVNIPLVVVHPKDVVDASQVKAVIVSPKDVKSDVQITKVVVDKKDTLPTARPTHTLIVTKPAHVAIKNESVIVSPSEVHPDVEIKHIVVSPHELKSTADVKQVITTPLNIKDTPTHVVVDSKNTVVAPMVKALVAKHSVNPNANVKLVVVKKDDVISISQDTIPLIKHISEDDSAKMVVAKMSDVKKGVIIKHVLVDPHEIIHNAPVKLVTVGQNVAVLHPSKDIGLKTLGPQPLKK
jgi:hypothetical protein